MFRMFRTDSLHPQTQQVFASLAAAHQAKGMLLIGGTALALHIAHRQSNDLDFLFVESNGKLPTGQIDRLIWHLRAEGHTAELITHSAQASTFRINTGELLSDYARDYAIDGVKVTFFAASKRKHPKRFAYWQNAPRDSQSGCSFQVLSLDGLKIAKTLVLQDRVRSRDLFDLMVLMRDHGYSIASLFSNVAQYADGATDGETERLILRGLMPLDRQDEGLASVKVETLMPEIYQFFDARLLEYEAAVHAQHLKAAQRPQSY
jgi:hypothetical protein